MGDGYVVEVPDGLNPLETTYPVVFSNRPRTVVASIERFLEGKAGRRFLWTGPDGVTGQYVCQKWKASYLFEMNCSISATFEKRHG